MKTDFDGATVALTGSREDGMRHPPGHLPFVLAVTMAAGALAMVMGCSKKPVVLPTAEEIRTEPLQIYMKIDGGFYVLRDPWHFFLDTEEGAWLIILRYPHKYRQPLEISDEQIAEFREAVIRERFFELKKEYGSEPGDDGLRGLRLILGGKVHSVDLLSFEDWADYSASEKEEIRRALRLWHLARAWFDAPAIMDFGPDDAALMGSTDQKPAPPEPGTSS